MFKLPLQMNCPACAGPPDKNSPGIWPGALNSRGGSPADATDQTPFSACTFLIAAAPPVHSLISDGTHFSAHPDWGSRCNVCLHYATSSLGAPAAPPH